MNKDKFFKPLILAYDFQVERSQDYDIFRKYI